MNLLLIFSNMLKYDIIIVLLAIVNVIVIIKLRQHSDNLYELINPTVYIPINQLLKETRSEHKGKTNLHYMRLLKEKETRYYNIFLSITGIFPLLGILGTILSLLKIITYSNAEVMTNFSSALTSTFWGLIFAIAFKGVNGLISSKIETNSEILSLLFTRIDESIEH